MFSVVLSIIGIQVNFDTVDVVVYLSFAIGHEHDHGEGQRGKFNRSLGRLLRRSSKLYTTSTTTVIGS